MHSITSKAGAALKRLAQHDHAVPHVKCSQRIDSKDVTNTSARTQFSMMTLAFCVFKLGANQVWSLYVCMCTTPLKFKRCLACGRGLDLQEADCLACGRSLGFREPHCLVHSCRHHHPQ